jgi:hypothetical protein
MVRTGQSVHLTKDLPRFGRGCCKKCGRRSCKPWHGSCKLGLCISHQSGISKSQNEPSPAQTVAGVMGCQPSNPIDWYYFLRYQEKEDSAINRCDLIWPLNQEILKRKQAGSIETGWVDTSTWK